LASRLIYIDTNLVKMSDQKGPTFIKKEKVWGGGNVRTYTIIWSFGKSCEGRGGKNLGKDDGKQPRITKPPEERGFAKRKGCARSVKGGRRGGDLQTKDEIPF